LKLRALQAATPVEVDFVVETLGLHLNELVKAEIAKPDFNYNMEVSEECS
jgi:hypothetical protein